jgi:uncharacterized damage-inducible protein DinB
VTLLLGGLTPPHNGDERTLLLAFLERQRELVCWKLDGLDDLAARREQTPSGLTIPVIVSHLTGVERGWIREHFAGEPEKRIRDDEFQASDVPLAELLAAYRKEIRACDEVIAGHELDDVSVHRDHNLRWILLHLIEEIGRHLGHLDLLAERADGRVGEEPEGAPPPGVNP